MNLIFQLIIRILSRQSKFRYETIPKVCFVMKTILHIRNTTAFYPIITSITIQILKMIFEMNSFYLQNSLSVKITTNINGKRNRTSELDTGLIDVCSRDLSRFIDVLTKLKKIKRHLLPILVTYSNLVTRSVKTTSRIMSQQNQLYHRFQEEVDHEKNGKWKKYITDSMYFVLAKVSNFEMERGLCCGDRGVIKSLVDIYNSQIKFRGKS